MAQSLPYTAHPLEVIIDTPSNGFRLDKALHGLIKAEYSRSRLSRLIAEGAVTGPDGQILTDPAHKVKPGERYTLLPPPPAPANPTPETIALDIVYEDDHLIVIDKPAGMVVHPAPGAESGTLVNALLAHCGPDFTGIGGVQRPGIVHRIDKLTSGLLVAAKTQRAHTHLSALFAAHTIERSYLGLTWGCPERADPRLAGLPSIGFEPGGWTRIATAIARHRVDRKRMAVTQKGGRHAVTRFKIERAFSARNNDGKKIAALLRFRLETGRTHQIRVHASHIGHPLIGDPVYGRPRRLSAQQADHALQTALAGFGRQALHAQSLGFEHPETGEYLSFQSPIPADMNNLLREMERNTIVIR